MHAEEKSTNFAGLPRGFHDGNQPYGIPRVEFEKGLGVLVMSC